MAVNHANFYEKSGIRNSGIDKENCVIRGVKILGKESSNGRTYSEAALDDVKTLYEGQQVYVDHDPSKPGKRSLRDGWGTLKNSRREGNDVFADLHYLDTHKMTPLILERVERMPDGFGLSHAAYGREKVSAKGSSEIERVERVYSVDLVTNPATNKNLFENADPPADPPPAPPAGDTTVTVEKLLIEAGLEMDASLPGLSNQVAMDPMAGRDQKNREAMKTMVSAIFDMEIGPDEIIGRIMDVLKVFSKKPKQQEPDPQETPPQPPDQREGDMSEQNDAVVKALEGVTNRLDQLEQRDQNREKRETINRVLHEQGFELSDVDPQQMKTLLEQDNADAVRDIVDKWPKKPPTLQLRKTGPVFESSTESDAIRRPQGGRHFATAMR